MNRLQTVPPMCPNGTYDVALVEWFTLAYELLRSLGLESRATIQFTNVSERNVRHCVGRMVHTGLHIASLPRLGKPSDYSIHQRVRRNLRRCVGRIVRTGLHIASLTRLGKPSDYCCSAFQAERAKHRLLAVQQCVRTEPSTLRWSNRSHRFTNRFAPSAWKAERLFNSPTRPNGTYDVALVELFAPVCRSLRSLGLESRATMAWKAERLCSAWWPLEGSAA